MDKHPERVVVAMSGGVDSSVAAGLLKQRGYDVVGIMLRLWSEGSQTANRCCTPSSMMDAEEIADILDIPFYVRDYKDTFHNTVVDYFKQGHWLGETPNPCLVCNREIRFGHLLEEALGLGADKLATGHYARVGLDEAGKRLLKTGLDQAKDQSYMLHRLDQYRLSKALFPVGEYTKPEIREIAREMGLPVHQKKDSQDLCFIGEGGHAGFLARHAGLEAKPGPIFNLKGEKLGTHQGITRYTVGQRRGLGIAWPEPLFVKEIDTEKNALFVGTKEECFVHTFHANRIHEILAGSLTEGKILSAKIRYKSPLGEMEILNVRQGRMTVRSALPLSGVTAGQGLVFYDGDVCLGGAIICK